MVTLNSAALDLVLHQLYVHFPVPGGLVRAVDGVDICFRHQQITGIIGESGCGKSVLGQAILGILPDYVARSGNIFYRSTDILADNTSLPGFYGQQIALIPQNPGDSLNPLRTIGRQFDDILQTAGFNDKTNQRKQQLLTFFGLPDAERVLAAYPHELSGGMLQRVLCAMSICCSPLWLLADEPTKGLDETACGVVYENLQKIKTSQSLGCSSSPTTYSWHVLSAPTSPLCMPARSSNTVPKSLPTHAIHIPRLSWQHCRKTAFSRCLACRHYRRIICPAVGLRRAAPAVKNAVCRKSRLSMTAAPRK